MAEADFGLLGLLKELGSRRPRTVQGFILTLGYSRLTCVGMTAILLLSARVYSIVRTPEATGEFKTAKTRVWASPTATTCRPSPG
jgi:hypothetical protein